MSFADSAWRARRRSRRRSSAGRLRVRRRAGDLHHRLHGLAQAGAAFAPRHRLPEPLPGHGLRFRPGAAGAVQPAGLARGRAGGDPDDHAVLRRHGGDAGDLRPGEIAGRHRAARRHADRPDPRHVPDGMAHGGLRAARSGQPAERRSTAARPCRGRSSSRCCAWRRASPPAWA